MNVGQNLHTPVTSLWALVDLKGASGDVDETYELSRHPRNYSYCLIHGYGPQYMDNRPNGKTVRRLARNKVVKWIRTSPEHLSILFDRCIP